MCCCRLFPTGVSAACDLNPTPASSPVPHFSHPPSPLFSSLPLLSSALVSVLLPHCGLMDDAIALSLSFYSGARVFVVGCDSIGALQAVIAVLQVATVESIISDIEIRFAGWATSSLRNHFRLLRWQQRNRAGFRLQDTLDEKVAH